MNNECEIKLEWINQDEFSILMDEVKSKYTPEVAPFTIEFPMKFAHGNIWNVNFAFDKENGFWLEDWVN